MHPYHWLCAQNPTTYICQALAPAQFAGLVQAAVAAIALAGIAVGVRLTRRTLDEMRAQTRTLRDQMVLTDRAWLKVGAYVAGAIKQRPNVDEEVLVATIRIEIENVGGSTAIGVDSTAMVFPVPVRGSIVYDQTNNWREVVETTRLKSSRADDAIPVARTVFPRSKKTVIEWALVIPMHDIEAQQYLARDGDEKGRPCVSLYLVGAVGYRLPNDETTMRVSSFGYDLKRQVLDDQGGYSLSLRFPLEEFRRDHGVGAAVEESPSLFTAD